MPDGTKLTRHDGAETLTMLEEIADLYVPVYSEPPYDPENSIHNREAFLDRTSTQARDPGFALIAARTDDGVLAAFSFGLPFGEGRWWYDVSGSTPPPEVVAAAKFAVIELVVGPAYRGQGLSSRLMDALVEGRPERYAMLLAHPDAPARSIYDKWGWEPVSKVQTRPDSEVTDVLVLRLAKD